MALSRRSRFVALGLVLLVVGGFAAWQLVGVFSGAGLTPLQADAELADEILAGHARLQAAVRTGSGTLERWREEPLPAGDELPPLNTSQASLQESDFYLRDDSARLDRHPQSNSNQAEGVFLETPEHGYIAHYSPGMNGEVLQNSDAKWQIDILLREPLSAAYGGYRASIATLLNTPGITISRRPFEDIPDAVWLEREFDEPYRGTSRIVLDPRHDYAVRDVHTQILGGPLQGDLRQRVQLTQLPDGSYVPHEVESINRLIDQPSGQTTEYRELVRVHLDSQEPPAEELFTLESLLALDPGNIVLETWQIEYSLMDQVEDAIAAVVSYLPGNSNGGPFSFALVIVTIGVLLAVCWLTYQRFKRGRSAAQS